MAYPKPHKVAVFLDNDLYLIVNREAAAEQVKAGARVSMSMVIERCIRKVLLREKTAA